MTDVESTPESDDFPAHGVLLGLDYGTRRVGIAVCTLDQTIATPLNVLTRQKPEIDGRFLLQLATEYEVVGVVVGLPLHLSGEEGAKAKESRTYGAWVNRTIELPVTFWDERYTTVIAETHMIAADLSRKKRKTRIDKIAAQIMLQGYLDRR